MAATHTTATPGRGCEPTLPVDLDGFPYQVDDTLGAWRLTKCCHAAVTYCDADLCCKGCYHDAEPGTDSPARLGPDWSPGEAVTVDLTTMTARPVGPVVEDATP